MFEVCHSPSHFLGVGKKMKAALFLGVDSVSSFTWRRYKENGWATVTASSGYLSSCA
jgi:queuine/archaeosine tRNA-ribosyltransferase